jgi:nitrate/nitrite transporter NarK
MSGAAVILAGSFCMPVLPGRTLPLAAASLFAFAHMAWMTNTTTLPIDLFASSQVGSVQGAIGAGSSLGGFISTGLIGYALTHASFTPVYITMSFLHPAALLLLLSFLPAAMRARKEVCKP